MYVLGTVLGCSIGRYEGPFVDFLIKFSISLLGTVVSNIGDFVTTTESIESLYCGVVLSMGGR